jgi:P22_AR N-terminal domain
MSDESTALAPIEEKRVNFYGDEIEAVLVEINDQREVYVPVRPICEYLGLTWSSQYMRLKRDDVLAEALSSVLIMRTEVGQRYEVVCLQLESCLDGYLGLAHLVYALICKTRSNAIAVSAIGYSGKPFKLMYSRWSIKGPSKPRQQPHHSFTYVKWA